MSTDNDISMSWSQCQDIPLTITTKADIELLPHSSTSVPFYQARTFKEDSDSDLSPDHIPRMRFRHDRRGVRRTTSALEARSSPVLSSFKSKQPSHLSLPQRFKLPQTGGVMYDSVGKHRLYSDSYIIPFRGNNPQGDQVRIKRRIKRENGFKIKHRDRHPKIMHGVQKQEITSPDKKLSPELVVADEPNIPRSLSLSALSFKEMDQSKQHHPHSSGSDVSDISSGELPPVIAWITGATGSKLSQIDRERLTDSGSTIVDKMQGSIAAGAGSPRQDRFSPRTSARMPVYQDSVESRVAGVMVGDEQMGNPTGLFHAFHEDSDSLTSGIILHLKN